MCNKAKAIEILSNEKADAAYELAEKHAIAKDQDWANESTIYTFDDNSQLLITSHVVAQYKRAQQ